MSLRSFRSAPAGSSCRVPLEWTGSRRKHAPSGGDRQDVLSPSFAGKRSNQTSARSCVDHSARSSTSLSVTVITSVAPSIATWPKNCSPSLGGSLWPCSVRRRLHVDELRAERVVERGRTEGAGVNRAGDEFPERLEVLEHRLVRIVVVRGGVMHVGGEPHGVADARALDEREQVGDFELAAERRAVALGDAFGAPFAVEVVARSGRAACRRRSPSRSRARSELALEPGDLLRARGSRRPGRRSPRLFSPFGPR